MLKFYGYLCVENEQEWESNRERNRLNHFYYAGGMGYEKPEHFPAFFKYRPDYDPRCCGDWIRVEKKEVLEYMDKCIQENQKLRERVEEMA